MKVTDKFHIVEPDIRIQVIEVEDYFKSLIQEFYREDIYNEFETEKRLTRHQAIEDAVGFYIRSCGKFKCEFEFKITPTQFGTDWGTLTVSASSYDNAVERMKRRLEEEDYSYDDYNLISVKGL